MLELDGHGYGHGVGLSQWGAYGYAVDFGWSAAEILDHYYGGTVAGTTDATTVTVRMSLHDDRQTAVVNDRGTLVVEGLEAVGGPWKSVVARETGPSSYTVWGRADQTMCPAGTTSLSEAGGWTVVGSGVTPSVTIRTQTDTSATTSFADLAALCEPDGKVRSYRGIIRAANGTDGENRTINVVPLEQYLRSVVAKEMSPSWATAGGGRGVQALQAQAVAARSYVLAENRYSYARTCDLSCQTYLGAALRSSVSSPYVAVEHPLVDGAVSATAGQVRRVGSATGPIAYAMFSAASGGYTAPTSLGFPAVPDLGDATAGNPNYRWSASIPAAVVQAAFPSIGEFVGVTVLARNGYGDWGGRVTSVRVDGSAGSVTVTGDQLRSKLALKSNWFNVKGSQPSSPASTPPQAAPTPSDGCAGRAAPAAGATAAVAPAARFTALAPSRLVDTRVGIGTTQQPLGPGCTLVVDPQVDASVTAVAVNLTAVDPKVSGYLTAYPCGVSRPITSVVQAIAGRVVAGMAIVPLSLDGTFCVYSNSGADLVIDLFGTYAPGVGQRFEPIAPVRRYDSRPRSTLLPAGTVVRVPIVAPGAAPAGATAAALTIHAMNAGASGFATVYPCSASVPVVSSVNVVSGGSVTNHVEVALNGAGEVCVYVDRAMHIAIDLSGWYGPAASTDFYALTPARVVDTRINLGLLGASRASVNRAVTLTGVGGVPAGGSVRAIAAQVTQTEATSNGYLTVHPCEAQVPSVSMVRYSPSGSAAGVVTGAVDGAGRWCILASSTAHVIVDVSGYFR